MQKMQIDYKKYISYLLIAYAFSFPISKAATNLFEILAILLISSSIIYSSLTTKFKSKKYKIISLLFAMSFILFSFTHNTLHTMYPMVFFALFGGFFNALSK